MLHLLADVEERLRVQVGTDREAGVQEVGLVGHFALGSGLVDGRGRHRLDTSSREGIAGGAEVGEPVPLVGAQAEVAGQVWPQAPGSAGCARITHSFHTSTETSSTGSGIGGSGLDAFTRTDSAPKRSIRRSATAVQSRSSVL